MKIEKKDIIYGCLIVVLTFTAYIPAMNGGFIWDDDLHVSENECLRSLDGLRRIWFEIGSLPQYYPLTFTSFWMNYQLWGLDTTGYHVVNVLLHAANALLLWVILRRLSVPGAWLAAAVFALHPVHVESAAWMSERKNVLSGFFYLASALVFLRFMGFGCGRRVSSPGAPGRLWRYYVLSLVLFLCALLSKTVTASLPAVLLLVMWWKRDKIPVRDVLLLVPFFAAGVALGLLTVFMEVHHVGAEGDVWNYMLVERILIAGRSVWFYAWKLLLPYRLTFSYQRWNIDAGAWWQYLFPLSAAAAVVALWFLRGRLGKGPLIGVLFFLGTLFPALGFFDVYPFKYSFVADHFQYLASIGVITLCVAGATVLYHRVGFTRRRGNAAAGMILAVLWILVWRQAHVYENIETLWLDTLAKNPNSWMASNNLGIYYYTRGEPARAVSYYEKALRIKPDHFKTHFNMGDVLQMMGRFEDAVAEYREAIRLKPDDVSSHVNLGNALKKMWRLDDAVEEYRKAIEIMPDFPNSYYNLGLAYMERGDNDSAAESFRKAVSLDPDFAEAYNNLGIVYFNMGRLDDSIKSYTEALRLRPDHAKAHYNLGYVLMKRGRLDEAAKYLSSALRIDPDFAAAHYNLGLVLEMKGRSREARIHFNKAKMLAR